MIELQLFFFYVLSVKEMEKINTKTYPLRKKTKLYLSYYKLSKYMYIL